MDYNVVLAQMVKNPPAMQETWVQSASWEDPLEKGMSTHFSILAWSWEDPLEKGMSTHFSILAWSIPWRRECLPISVFWPGAFLQRSLAGYNPWGRKEPDTTE